MIKYLSILLLLMITATAFAQRELPPGVTLEANVSNPNPYKQDYFEYTVTLVGNVEPQRTDWPDFGNVKGLQMIKGPESSTRMVSNNNVVVVTQQWTFTLTANIAGELTIPPAKLRIAGYDYPTEAITVKARDLPESTITGFENVIFGRSRNAQLQNMLRGNCFAVAEHPESIYEGQVVPITIYVYKDNAEVPLQFRQFDIARGPESNDFLFPNPSNSQQQSPRWESVRMSGRDFQRIALTTFHAVPTKSGKLSISAPLPRVYFIINNNRRQRDLNSLFGFSINSVNHEPVELPINPIVMDVKPLPEAPDDTLYQIVGDVSPKITADPTELRRRELLNLRFELVGSGYFALLSPPELDNLPHFRMLDTASESELALRGKSLISRRIFDFTFQATGEGELEIPSFKIAVFDPNTEQQDIIETDPIPVRVEAANADTVQVGGAKEGFDTPGAAGENRADARELGQDVVYINTERLTADSIAPRRPFYTQSWFFAAQALPLFLSLGYGIGLVRARNGNGMTAEKRRKLARAGVKTAVKEAQLQIESAPRDEFYATLSKGVMTYIASLLNRSEKGMTIEEAEEAVAALQFAENDRHTLFRLLRQFDAIRYSPAPDTQETRKETIGELEDLLIKLEQAT